MSRVTRKGEGRRSLDQPISPQSCTRRDFITKLGVRMLSGQKDIRSLVEVNNLQVCETVQPEEFIKRRDRFADCFKSCSDKLTNSPWPPFPLPPALTPATLTSRSTPLSSPPPPALHPVTLPLPSHPSSSHARQNGRTLGIARAIRKMHLHPRWRCRQRVYRFPLKQMAPVGVR